MKTQKNSPIFGIFAIVVAFGLSLLGCPDKPDSGNGGKNPPAKPTVSVEVVPTGIEVSWNEITEDGVTINVYRRTDSTGSGTAIATNLTAALLSYIDTTGVADTNYSYQIAAKNSAGETKSDWSTEITFPESSTQIPDVPTSVVATADSLTEIIVTWAHVTGSAGYRVYMDTSASGTFMLLASGPSLITGVTYTVTNLNPSTTYYFKIVAVNGAGNSAMSTVASAKTKDPSEMVDFTNYTSGYVFRVKTPNIPNNERLIAFMGDPLLETIIGGVPSNANGNGFKKDIAMFGSTSKTFVVTFLTESQFNSNYSNLSTVKDTPFTRIYAYYNATGNNENVYEIAEGLGGEYELIVKSSNQYDVELRLNSPNGPVLGFVPTQTPDTTFNVSPNTMQVFPIVRKFNPTYNEIISFTPIYGESSTTKSIDMDFNSTEPTGTIDIDTQLTGMDFTTGCAFLLVENQSTTNDVNLYVGNDRQMTSVGINYIQVGATRMFQINMTVTPDGKYAQTANINPHQIGSTVANAVLIGNYDLESDKIYKVVVTGNEDGFTVAGPVYVSNMNP